MPRSGDPLPGTPEGPACHSPLQKEEPARLSQKRAGPCSGLGSALQDVLKFGEVPPERLVEFSLHQSLRNLEQAARLALEGHG